MIINSYVKCYKDYYGDYAYWIRFLYFCQPSLGIIYGE